MDKWIKCKCGSEIHPKRFALGYKTCINCSSEERKAVIQISNHKTGNEIQIVSQETAREFNHLASRSSFGVSTGVKGRR
jgi:hypothetical protein